MHCICADVATSFSRYFYRALMKQNKEQQMLCKHRKCTIYITLKTYTTSQYINYLKFILPCQATSICGIHANFTAMIKQSYKHYGRGHSA